jgi:DNA-directed RNA polymerase subunit RPC12/RpoP
VSSDSKVRLYSCRHCGEAYTANPPDDVHITAVANVEGGEDDIQITYHCTACSKDNKLTWIR